MFSASLDVKMCQREGDFTKNNNFVIYGNFCYSINKSEIRIHKNEYLICVDGKVEGIYKEIPKEYSQLKIVDYTDKIIIPGMSDLHAHAPQYANRGLGMDYELIEWLNKTTFVEEAKFADMEYTKKAYDIFVEDLKKSPTTRVCLFGTIHNEATIYLMESLEKAGFKGYVGKVNMDRNSPDYLCEKDVETSKKDTKRWIENSKERFENIKPILTPRFIPSCTDEMMRMVSELQKEYNLPVQSHLSENLSEIEWVKELVPESKFYGDAYNMFEVFGDDVPTIMAHCVYSSDEEIKMMKEQNVYIAHCAQSNENLSSGIAPIRKYLDADMKLGLGTDISGGASLSMFRCIVDTITLSILYWRLIDNKCKALSFNEAFYMATKGGGSFFGKVGSFEKGYEFDAVVLDDSLMPYPQELNILQRLERMVYLSDDRQISAKYISGKLC